MWGEIAKYAVPILSSVAAPIIGAGVNRFMNRNRAHGGEMNYMPEEHYAEGGMGMDEYGNPFEHEEHPMYAAGGETYNGYPEGDASPAPAPYSGALAPYANGGAFNKPFGYGFSPNGGFNKTYNQPYHQFDPNGRGGMTKRYADGGHNMPHYAWGGLDSLLNTAWSAAKPMLNTAWETAKPHLGNFAKSAGRYAVDTAQKHGPALLDKAATFTGNKIGNAISGRFGQRAGNTAGNFARQNIGRAGREGLSRLNSMKLPFRHGGSYR